MRTDKNISVVFNFTLLIIGLLSGLLSWGQKQSGQYESDGLDSPVYAEARDSIKHSVREEVLRMYGEAVVQYEDIELRADLIEVDLKTNEVTATYSLDSLGNPVGKPVFVSGGEESACEYMKYNIETKKGFVREVRMQQGEGYIHMKSSKMHPDEQIHFKKGKFTTCDREEPHFHFNLSRAIVVPEKRIVTGPVYMEILHVPTPLALPFGFFPNSETKKSGIILPEFQNSNQYGFGLENLGYYIPLGDFWETYFYGSIFTTGSWAGSNKTNYYKKYKYRGGFGIRYEQFRGKFYEGNSLDLQKWTINWNHNQDAKAHPSLKFTTSINFVSDNNAATTLDPINPTYFNNTFNSSINVTKAWRANKFNGTMGLQTNLQQNSQSGNYILKLPVYNLSVNRFDLGVLRKNKIGSKWYEKITVTYSMNAQNLINAPDSIFNASDFNQIGTYARNGLEHKVLAQSNLRLLGGRFVFNPSVNYREYWNFQYEERVWNDDTQKIDTVDFDQFRAARDLSFTGGLKSNFFGYYKFKGKQKMKFRHVASPSASFTYQPEIDLYEEIQVDTLGKTSFYSPFSRSLYTEGSRGSSARINFGLTNTIEMKKRVKGDTINETMKAFKLVDALSVTGNYDFLKDSMNLSNLALAFRTSRFFNIFSFQSNASLSPYSWVDSTGVTTSEYAWNDGKGIGRIKSAGGVLNANFTNKKGRERQKEKEKAAEGDAIETAKATDPNNRDYSIPWVLNLSYNITYGRNSSTNALGALVDTFSLVQTLRADGNISLNDKWKIDFNVNYDIQENEVPNFNIGLWRDLHCWETSLFYQQIGPMFPENGLASNWSVLFKIGVKASMFQDIKYDHTFNNPF